MWVLSQTLPEATSSVKALVLKRPGEASVEMVPNPVAAPGELLLRVRMVGFCGSDLNSFRGRNPLVTFPRIPGHEVSATVIEGDGALPAGTDVALSSYTNCGRCASCRRGRSNACQFNQTLGVQRDGALAEFVAMPRDKLYPAKLTTKELCLVEPLTVGFHAVARGLVKADDTVAILGCGGVGLGAIAASNARGARTICVDMDDEKLVVARAAGGSDAVNTAKESLHDRLQELTEGRGPDVVIEAIGTPQTFRAAVEEVAFTGQSGVHRLCKRTGKLRDETLCAKRVGHSRFAKRAAGRFSCGNPSSRGEKVSCRSGCEFGGAARRGGECPAVMERESGKLQEDHGLR